MDWASLLNQGQLIEQCKFCIISINKNDFHLSFCILCRVWPEYVKDRIRTTYMYFGGSVLLTAASAMACFRSPVIMNAVMGNSWMVE